MKNKVKVKEAVSKRDGRRKFLKISGLAIAGSGLLLSCSNDDDNPNPPEGTKFDLGSGNLGILNYAYALEQLEAAFYTKVLDGAYFNGANSNEKTIFSDIQKHEVIHRDFFKTAITAAVDDESKVLPTLDFDFSSVNFDDRGNVLDIAQALEDTGVMAYNGAGHLIDASNSTGQTYLLLAGKIVSVEARHASAIRNLQMPGTSNFAGDDALITLPGGGPNHSFDKATPPADILMAVAGLGYVKTAFTADNLPQG